jgi:methionyl-tRNA formyltransferase
LPAADIYNRIRAFNPWPSCFFYLPAASAGEEILVKVWRASVEKRGGPAGEIIDISGEGPVVAAGRDALRLIELQPEGKKTMTGRDFLNGYRVVPGMKAGKTQ